jgi:hypothetical protein
LRILNHEPAYIAAYLSSSVGQTFADRQKTEQINPYISLENLRTLPFFSASPGFQKRITTVVALSANERHLAERLIAKAENSLIAALGLSAWQPPEPSTYTRTASAAFAERRLDAEYFAPRVRELLERLGANGQTISDVAPARREKFVPTGEGEFDYIEISDLNNDGTVGSTRLAQRDAPSRATQIVRAKDVITSTVRPIRRLSALIVPEQSGSVCSSGFLILNPAPSRPKSCSPTFDSLSSVN